MRLNFLSCQLIGKLFYLVVVEIRLHEFFRLVRMLTGEVGVESMEIWSHPMLDGNGVDAALEFLFA